MPYWKFRDPKVQRRLEGRMVRFWNYVWQPVSALVFLWVMLFTLDRLASSQVLWASGSVALAGSAFMVFVMPGDPESRWFRILLGYIIAIAVGEGIRIGINAIFHTIPTSMVTMVSDVAVVHNTATSLHARFFELGAAVAFCFMSWVMAICKIPHTPAVGFAVVMVTESRDWIALIILGIGAVTLVLLRIFLRNMLVDLV